MKKKGDIRGLIPLFVFLGLYASAGIFTGDFSTMPLLVAFILTTGVSLSLNKKGEKQTLDEKVEIFCKGAGDSTLILMVVIFLLAGGFYSVADAMGAVSSTVNLGLSVLPAKMLLPGLFLVGCVLSFSMGTSMGTVSALTPVAVGIASETGIGLPLVCGVVIGGAMFGDNMSFISDTTIAATRTQEVGMRDKFKVNLAIVLPAVIINLILISFMGGNGVEGKVYEYSLINIIPYISIIILSLIGLNVINVLGIGIALGLGIGLMNGSFQFIEIFGILQRGFGWMQDILIIAIVVGGVVALMHNFGGIDFILENLTSRIRSRKGAEAGIAALVSILDLSTTNNTVSIITAGPLARDIADKFGVDRKRVAGLLDIFSSSFQGLMPYAGQILMAAGMAQISPASIVPYSWYSMLMFVMGVLSIATGLPNFKTVQEEGKERTYERVAE